MPKEIDKKVVVEKAVKVTTAKPVGVLAGELLFDVAIPKGRYDILKAYIDAGFWYTPSVEIVKDNSMIRLEIFFGEITYIPENADSEVELKMVNAPVGDLLFDIAIPEGKYNIIKAYEENWTLHVVKFELLEDSKIHISLAFGSIKMGKVVIPKDAFGFTSGLTVKED